MNVTIEYSPGIVLLDPYLELLINPFQVVIKVHLFVKMPQSLQSSHLLVARIGRWLARVAFSSIMHLDVLGSVAADCDRNLAPISSLHQGLGDTLRGTGLVSSLGDYL